MWGIPIRILVLLGYICLLLISAVYEAIDEYKPEPRDEQLSREISVSGGDGKTHSAEIRFLDTDPEASSDKPVVLVLHGSPVATSAVQGLIDDLAKQRRVVAPDLPGFGRSPSWSGGYSIESHARAALALLSDLGIENCHLIGYSMGGGVAIEMSLMNPAILDSLVLVSSIGLQEYELLGDYSLNRAVHGTQLFALWTIDWLIPDFGFFERQPLNLNYARNFYQTDQRRLRYAIESWANPVLVLHGARDFLVPVEAAREHARLMPQAKLEVYQNQGHMAVIRDPKLMTPDINDFLQSVESDEAAHREDLHIMGVPVPVVRNQWGLGALLAVATFASEDLACIGGGLLASKSSLPLSTAIAACFLGIFVGDFAIYLVGRFLGRAAFTLPILNRIAHPERVDRFAKWFDNQGLWLIVSTRFLPGSRVPTYFAAGLVKAGAFRFASALLVACGLWTPILVGLSYWIGGRFLEMFERHEGVALLGLLLTVIGLLLAIRIGAGAMTWRGRRLLYSKFKRLVRWEFWPWWLLYPPVYLYLIWLMIKHRSLTVYSAVNPFMPAGGLVYESKSDILRHLRDHDCPVAPFGVIDHRGCIEDRINAVKHFMERERLEFPIVLKPDVGQRGQGVKIARSWKSVRHVLSIQEEDTIVQRFVGGAEYGVFYYRYPSQSNGCILSITDKRFTSVRGDGVSNLEELILNDKRAICMADYFLEAHKDDLDTVLDKDEEKALAELGTHCRGALFLDGDDLITDALNQKIDAFSRRVRGFNFGRFDVRTPSAEALANGENIQIIELNGLTSESTNMYDPKHGLFFAYRTLFNQWKIAFEIGKENRNRGAHGSRLAEVLRLILDYLAGESPEAVKAASKRYERH